jgi:hypothetical protein
VEIVCLVMNMKCRKFIKLLMLAMTRHDYFINSFHVHDTIAKRNIKPMFAYFQIILFMLLLNCLYLLLSCLLTLFLMDLCQYSLANSKQDPYACADSDISCGID